MIITIFIYKKETLQILAEIKNNKWRAKSVSNLVDIWIGLITNAFLVFAFLILKKYLKCRKKIKIPELFVLHILIYCRFLELVEINKC